jgi:hypothetical protein
MKAAANTAATSLPNGPAMDFKLKDTCALLLLVVACVNGAEARTVVLRATGPSASEFRPGSILPEPLKLKLKAGDRLTVLDTDGTRQLVGPAVVNDTIKRPPRPARKLTLDDLVGSRSRPRTGAVRGPGVPRPAELWQVDPARGGDWCAIDLASIALWRSDASRPADLNLSSEAGSTTVIHWNRGDTTLGWPTAVPPADSARYTFAGATKSKTVLTLHKVQAHSSLKELARDLDEHRCDEQLQFLLER